MAKIMNRYNQVPHQTRTPNGEVTKTQENITYKRAKNEILPGASLDKILKKRLT